MKRLALLVCPVGWFITRQNQYVQQSVISKDRVFLTTFTLYGKASIMLCGRAPNRPDSIPAFHYGPLYYSFLFYKRNYSKRNIHEGTNGIVLVKCLDTAMIHWCPRWGMYFVEIPILFQWFSSWCIPTGWTLLLLPHLKPSQKDQLPYYPDGWQSFAPASVSSYGDIWMGNVFLPSGFNFCIISPLLNNIWWIFLHFIYEESTSTIHTYFMGLNFGAVTGKNSKFLLSPLWW